MRTTLCIHSCLLMVLFPGSYSMASELSNQLVDVAVWSTVESKCQRVGEASGYVECEIHAYKMNYTIGFDVHLEVNKSEYYTTTTLGTILSGGLLLPVFLLTELGKTYDFDERAHRIVGAEVEVTQPVASTSVTVKIDGTPTGSYVTDVDGRIRFQAPSDSVIELYSIYEPRSLSLNQSLYLDAEGEVHYHQEPSKRP